jgi:methylenetetrahydrofolate dehydrogenase (NADP+)/methenyltetrahydrofolate cyclohydrolase
VATAPRVGDGVLLVDSYGRVEYSSPNGVSALHRVGVHALAEGRRFGELGLDELLDVVDELNHDRGVHGILVQLPLPPQIDEQDVLDAAARLSGYVALLGVAPAGPPPAAEPAPAPGSLPTV